MMRRGVLTLVFDDGYRAVYDRVLPLLRQYGIRAVFGVPTDTASLERAEGAPVASFEEWKRACTLGSHELAAHGATHRALTTLPDAKLHEELQRGRDATAATTLVYPGGAHDARVVAATARIYDAARTVLPGFEEIPPHTPYQLHSYTSTKTNFSVWVWNLRVLWACLTNQWLIETHHNVAFGDGLWATGHGKRHTIPLDAFERHLRFVRRLPIRIATIREIMHAERPAWSTKSSNQ